MVWVPQRDGSKIRKRTRFIKCVLKFNFAPITGFELFYFLPLHANTNSAEPLLRRLKCTVKAPNFDRVFIKNNFFLNIFYRWHPLEKFDRMYKIRNFVMSKLKFRLVVSTVPPKNISHGVEVTSWAANFDRNIHFWKIMATRGKCMARGTCMSLKNSVERVSKQ
jgi:hypothetical protein